MSAARAEVWKRASYSWPELSVMRRNSAIAPDRTPVVQASTRTVRDSRSARTPRATNQRPVSAPKRSFAVAKAASSSLSSAALSAFSSSSVAGWKRIRQSSWTDRTGAWVCGCSEKLLSLRSSCEGSSAQSCCPTREKNRAVKEHRPETQDCWVPSWSRRSLFKIISIYSPRGISTQVPPHGVFEPKGSSACRVSI